MLSKCDITTKRKEEFAQDKRRCFSIDLNSRNSLSRASLDNARRGRESKNDEITIEGTIGLFKKAQFIEGEVLEICGSEGVLRIDLTEEEIAVPSTTTYKSKPQ